MSLPRDYFYLITNTTWQVAARDNLSFKTDCPIFRKTKIFTREEFFVSGLLDTSPKILYLLSNKTFLLYLFFSLHWYLYIESRSTFFTLRNQLSYFPEINFSHFLSKMLVNLFYSVIKLLFKSILSLLFFTKWQTTHQFSSWRNFQAI